MKPSPSSKPDRSTAASSSAPGSAPTNRMLESCGLDQLTSELAQRLTALESHGWLNDTGKSLLLLLLGMTPSQSTAGSAPKKDTCGTFTYPQRYDGGKWLEDYLKRLQEQNTQHQNHYPTFPQGTWCGTTPGWETKMYLLG